MIFFIITYASANRKLRSTLALSCVKRYKRVNVSTFLYKELIFSRISRKLSEIMITFVSSSRRYLNSLMRICGGREGDDIMGRRLLGALVLTL